MLYEDLFNSFVTFDHLELGEVLKVLSHTAEYIGRTEGLGLYCALHDEFWEVAKDYNALYHPIVERDGAAGIPSVTGDGMAPPEQLPLADALYFMSEALLDWQDVTPNIFDNAKMEGLGDEIVGIADNIRDGEYWNHG